MPNNTAIEVELHAFDSTTGTVKFREELPEGDFLAMAKLGTIYVPKVTLSAMGWDGTSTLKLTLKNA